MTKASDAFEALVERIVRLAQTEATEVVRDDAIDDPNDPTCPRQVDVTFFKNGKRVFVECRDHASRQDVQWVEELLGRRISLNCDQMIGVSSSGFTKLAQKKALAHGILLWEVGQLTDDEILAWGTSVLATVGFVKFQNISICIESPVEISSGGLAQVERFLLDGGHVSNWLNSIALDVGKKLSLDESSPISVDLHNHPAFLLNINLSTVTRFSLTGIASFHEIHFSVCGAKTSCSILLNDDHKSHVFEFEQSWTELHLQKGVFGWAIDFSKVRFDIDCLFGGRITLDMGVPRAMNRAYISGLDQNRSILTVPKIWWRRQP